MQQALDANYQISVGPHFPEQYGKHLLNCAVRRGSTARSEVCPSGSSSCLQRQESTLMYSTWSLQPHRVAGEAAGSLSFVCQSLWVPLGYRSGEEGNCQDLLQN